MIKTIYEYGALLQHTHETESHFSIYSPPYSAANATDNIILYAEIRQKAFQGISVEAYDAAAMERYIFRALASANAAPVVPSLYIYYDDNAEKWADNIEKFQNKLERCLHANQKLFDKYLNIKELVEKLPQAFQKLASLKKGNYFFTLKFTDDDSEKYLGDIPEIKQLLETSAYDKYFKSKDGFYKASDKFCAVTYQPVEEVWGRVDTLGFTVNDISFSRNGFHAKDSYKMFPVHPEAVKVLEGTMNLLERELFFNFYNMRFFVLPHFVAITDRNVRQELAENFYQKCKVNAKEAKENARTFANLNQSIFNSETLFHVLVEDQDLGRNDLYYDIFFYEQKQAQFAIKLHVSDVLPSRFRALLDAKEYIENKYSPITRKTTKEGKPYIYYMRFTNIKDYFSSKVKTDIIFEPIFFKIVEALFYKSQLNENQIIKAFLNKIVLAFKSDGTGFEFQDQVKHSFCIHQFFQILQLFGDMPQNVEKNALVALTVTEFVAQHPFFFAQKSPLKKAAFYLGCAAEVLLTAQRVRLGSEPFLKDLNNLQLGYKELQTIYPRLLAKAKQYQEAGNLHDKYFNALLTDFLENIVLVDPAENDKIAASFAFSLGLVMEKSFLSERIRLAKERKEARENE